MAGLDANGRGWTFHRCCNVRSFFSQEEALRLLELIGRRAASLKIVGAAADTNSLSLQTQ